MNNLELLELAYAKLAFLQKQEILVVEPTSKFKLQHDIQETKQEIERLEKENLTGFKNLSGLKGDDPKIDISRLPKPSMDLVGRIDEIKQLDQAVNDQKTQLVYLWAGGGVGKSALTFKWLQNMQPDYHNVEKVFAWSFYSQGSHNTQNSSLPFFQKALEFFDFNGEIPQQEVEKGRLLGKYLRKQSVILILDGLEPLQHPAHILDGELKDKALQALFDDLFYYGLTKNSLMVVSSRQPLRELESWREESYLTIDLQTLNKEEGAKLLKKLKVKGTTEGLEQEELEKTTVEWGGHALALVLLGKLLRNKFAGNIRFRNKLPPLWTDEKFGGHALRVLKFYEEYWSSNSKEYIFMLLISLFDRPMEISEKQALIKTAKFAEPLQNLEEVEWEQLELWLENAGMLLSCDPPRIYWDCHPLIREYFCEQFKKKHFELFQQAHLVLFEFYQQYPEKYQPDTLEELTPLYRAVVHGCLAGKYLAARKLYSERIRRGNEGYSTHKLGKYSEDLTTLAAFFPNGWIYLPTQNLSEGYQAWLLGIVSFCLMSQGRLIEAIESRKMHLNIRVKKEEWKKAANSARHLNEILIYLGNLKEAINIAEQSIYYASKSNSLYEQMKSYSRFANTCYLQAQFSLAEQYFKKAKQLQMQRQPKKPELYSLSGFLYFNWYLEQDISEYEYNRILEHQKNNLIWYVDLNENWLLSIALDSFIIARTYVKLNELELANKFFEQSVDNIRKANRIEFIPMFLIARGNYLLEINEIKEAVRDLDEIKQLISRCGMKLYEVDYHLAMCRYYLIKTNSYKTSNPSSHAGAWELENDNNAQSRELENSSPLVPTLERGNAEDSDFTQAKSAFFKHLSISKTLIKSTGYHLRDKSVSELEIQMNSDKNTHKHE